MPIFAFPEFPHGFRVSQLGVAWNNLNTIGADLAEPDLVQGSDDFEIKGLIGVDIIQFFPMFQLVPCMQGSAWRVPGGL